MRRSMVILLTVSILGAALLMSLLIPMDHETRPKPPNIIFLLTDDQRWDALGAMGNTQILTPNLDKLAAEGVLYKNAYVTTPICCTSRASILSGQYARRHKINDFKTHFSTDAWQQCYPPLLKKAGYYNGFVGKYGVGLEEDFPRQDFDFWKGLAGQPHYEQKDENGQYLHLTRMLGNQSLEFLASTPTDKPFCLSVSFKAPHVQDEDARQFIYDPEYAPLFTYLTVPPAKNGSDEFYNRFPDFFKENNEARNRWQIRFANPEMYQNSIKGYYRLIYGVDVVVGRIREQLKKQGLAENTVIIFMGDNGFFLGEKGLAGKWFAYEESIRVPLLIYDPRLPEKKRGKKLDQIALNIDIAPTILRMAGIKPPKSMQGKNLMPTYFDEVRNWRKDFLFEHEFTHPGLPKSEGLISTTKKYFHYLPPSPDHEEMYDLTSDPDELINLAADPQFDEEKKLMQKRLQDLILKAQ